MSNRRECRVFEQSCEQVRNKVWEWVEDHVWYEVWERVEGHVEDQVWEQVCERVLWLLGD